MNLPTCQHCLPQLQKQWWIGKAKTTQKLTDVNNFHEFYDAMKEIYGLTRHKIAPLKSKDRTTLLKSKDKILRWGEHFSKLLTHVNPTNPTIVEEIPLMN